jgi:hypothetical protein
MDTFRIRRGYVGQCLASALNTFSLDIVAIVADYARELRFVKEIALGRHHSAGVELSLVSIPARLVVRANGDTVVVTDKQATTYDESGRFLGHWKPSPRIASVCIDHHDRVWLEIDYSYAQHSMLFLENTDTCFSGYDLPYSCAVDCSIQSFSDDKWIVFDRPDFHLVDKSQRIITKTWTCGVSSANRFALSSMVGVVDGSSNREAIRTLPQAAVSDLWILSFSTGHVCRFDSHSRGRTLEPKGGAIYVGIDGLNVDSILVVHDHNFAILPQKNVLGGAVYVFRIDGHLESIFHLSSKHVKDICFDVHGRLHVLTEYGVCVLDV